jgi:hypothetical protein
MVGNVACPSLKDVNTPDIRGIPDMEDGETKKMTTFININKFDVHSH